MIKFFKTMTELLKAMWAVRRGRWYTLRDASDDTVNDLASVHPAPDDDPVLHELVRQARVEQALRKQRRNHVSP